MARRTPIVCVLDHYPPVVLAGAEIAVHNFNRALLATGTCDVTVYICTNSQAYPEEYEGVRIRPMRPMDCYSMTLEPGTVVVSQLWAARVARNLFDRQPPVAACRYIEHIHYVDRSVISPYPFTSREFGLVYNSEDTRRRAQEIGAWLCSKQSWVVPPLIAPAQSPLSARKSASDYPWVTLVNFSKDKGADMFNRIAAAAPAAPAAEYVAVRGAHGAQEAPHEAVRLIEPTRDMEAVWAQTRILCVLSTYETWSMVASEAMLRGIPVICADHIPALRENCGDAAVYIDRTSPTAAHAAITAIEANYAEYSERARARGAAQYTDTQAKMFEVVEFIATV
jgi:hypothetical protein